MKQLVLINVLFLVLLIGCDSKPAIELTKEQAVYEALFFKITGNAHSEFYLVEVTESNWFNNNPFDESEWENRLDSLGGIDIEMIKRLYNNNEKSEPINWTPFVTNAQLLPSEFNVDPHRSGENCFASAKEGNIGIRENGKSFRSYYTISNVAFSTDGKKAILKFSRHCAPMSGAGEFFVVFEFVGKQWKVLGGRTLWVS